MSSQEYLDMMKEIHENILNFLEEEAKPDDNFQILKDKFINSKIRNNEYDLLSLLHLISKIANNYHRFPNFFSKIERILQFFKEDIKKYFSNSEIFNIFKSNKRILLFLIEQQIIFIDEYIAKQITTTKKYIISKYPQYFHLEIQPFIKEKWFPRYDPEDIELKKNRWEGENDSYICELIRNDTIEEFVSYVTRSNFSLHAKIQPSIYETNSFLLKKPKESNQNQVHVQNDQEDCIFSLIEYAVFFGSIQIFNHLRLEGVEITPSLWHLAIHGKNAEIIHFLEDNHVELEDESYKQVFYESIKCHHNDIANYFINNFMENDEENSQDTIKQSLKYYNFTFLKKELINEPSFFDLCKNDYCVLVDNLFKDKDIDANKKEIFNILLI